MSRYLIALVLILILIAGAFEWESANFAAPGPVAHKGKETVVLVASGIGLQGIAETLSGARVIQSPGLFELGVRLRRTKASLKAGEYAIPSRASMLDIMEILIAGKSIQHKVTAAEGLTSDMIYKLVKAEAGLFGDPGPLPPEGSLLPETYLYTHGATRADMIARMRAAQQTYLDEVWETRAQDLPIKTKEQTLILASIVEKETAIPKERRHIAAVFERRLKLGMKLQSDPTIIYGITKGYPLGRRIRESEIAKVTPYNTYVISALPAGPICNPGKDAIAAVLNPGETKDLYFVANGTGGHAFAATQAEQDKNVAIWRKIEATHQ
jgi:UPF0755 protein